MKSRIFIQTKYSFFLKRAVSPRATLRLLWLLEPSSKCVLFWFLSDPSPIIGYACHSLTHWLPNSVLFSKLDWCDPGVWRCQLKTCWGLLLLLMLMMRIMLATVWCILGSWSLVIKPNFCSDFEHKVCSRFWCWSSGKILPLIFCSRYEVESWSRCWS